MHADNTSSSHWECCGLAFSRHPSLPLLSLSWPVEKSQADIEPELLGWQVLPGRISPPAAVSLASAQQASDPPFLLLGLLISYAAVWSPRTAVGAARSLDVFCYARHKHRSLWLLVERSKIGERRGCVICQLYPDRLLKKMLYSPGIL